MIDYATPIGKVRLLISDVDEANLLLSDAQVTGFLSIAGNSVYRAAARALRTIATSEVLTSKVIRMQNGTTTDGAKVSAELRALALTYDADAIAEEEAKLESSFFEIVPNGETKAEAAEWGGFW